MTLQQRMIKMNFRCASSPPPVKFLFGCMAALLLCSEVALAEGISYVEAEQQALTSSYSTQASQAFEQAARLDAQATKGLGRPRIDLNVRAYKFHSEVDLPLDSFKQNLENTLSQRLSEQLSQVGGVLPPDVLNTIQTGANTAISDGINQFPNYANLSIEDEVIRPTISLVMPIYTGGLIKSAKQIATIQAMRAQLSTEQQQDIQRFEIIQAYFNTQLQTQLVKSSQFNADAMQKHVNNVFKLEQQGFISKGQRMQFEVARNNALRLLQNAQSNLNSSQFQLNHLLHQQTNGNLTTPLFVNTKQTLPLNQFLSSYPNQSNLIRKMQIDTQLADENVKAQRAAKKPTVFAFAEYSLDKNENWIVGVVARYNLFGGLDKNKSIESAELKRYGSQLLVERTKQEIENIIQKSYSEMGSSQQTQTLLNDNKRAALENLRIQELSFRENMGTANQVIDAQNAVQVIDTEMAINAYKYVLSLATLLQSHGSISQFKTYLNQPNTVYIY